MFIMVSTAVAYLILLEPFLALKLGEIGRPTSAPVLQRRDERGLYLEHRPSKLTKYFLFTIRSARDGRSLSIFEPESFHNFDPSRETKIIVHGFLDKVRIADWMHSMKDEFLRHGDYNVIIVDWSSGNSIPYSQAAANTEIVGGEIADLILFLRDRMGGRTETFHVIGHSLGSHVAGFVGERIKPLGRITGLDPAMIHFKGATSNKRLDPSDAIFVDAIHTDAGGIGMIQPVGHADFYPNGGSLQPGCDAVNYLTSLVRQGVVESVRNLICSHMRAILLFTESINSQSCQFRASSCQSWKEYEDGRCGDCGPNGQNCATMGLHTDTSRNYGNQSYFLMTASISPFCVFEYRVRLDEAGKDGRAFGNLLPSVWRRGVEGLNRKSFLMTLLGSSTQADIALEERNQIDSRSYVITSRRNLGNIDKALLRWKPNHVGGTVVDAVANILRQDNPMPLITRAEVKAINTPTDNGNGNYVLCASPTSMDTDNAVVGLRSNFC